MRCFDVQKDVVSNEINKWKLNNGGIIFRTCGFCQIPCVGEADSDVDGRRVDGDGGQSVGKGR